MPGWGLGTRPHKKLSEVWVQLISIEAAAFLFWAKNTLEGVEAKTLLWRFHSVRPLLIYNFHTYSIKVGLEEIIKLGEMYIHLLLRIFEVELNKIVAHFSALV